MYFEWEVTRTHGNQTYVFSMGQRVNSHFEYLNAISRLGYREVSHGFLPHSTSALLASIGER